MEWLDEGTLVIGNKVYHITNPNWIRNFFNRHELYYDNDTSKDQRSSEAKTETSGVSSKASSRDNA